MADNKEREPCCLRVVPHPGANNIILNRKGLCPPSLHSVPQAATRQTLCVICSLGAVNEVAHSSCHGCKQYLAHNETDQTVKMFSIISEQLILGLEDIS